MERNIFTTLQDLVLFPPPNNQYASGEDVGDDDVGLSSNTELLSNVIGIAEVNRTIDAVDVDNNSIQDEENAAADVRRLFPFIKPKLPSLFLYCY